MSSRPRDYVRKDSIWIETGREGQELAAGSAAGKALGVFTSGGDSQGIFSPIFKQWFRSSIGLL